MLAMTDSGAVIPYLEYILVDLVVERKVIKNSGFFVKHAVKGGGVVQGTQSPL